MNVLGKKKSWEEQCKTVFCIRNTHSSLHYSHFCIWRYFTEKKGRSSSAESVPLPFFRTFRCITKTVRKRSSPPVGFNEAKHQTFWCTLGTVPRRPWFQMCCSFQAGFTAVGDPSSGTAPVVLQDSDNVRAPLLWSKFINRINLFHAL